MEGTYKGIQTAAIEKIGSMKEEKFIFCIVFCHPILRLHTDYLSKLVEIMLRDWSFIVSCLAYTFCTCIRTSCDKTPVLDWSIECIYFTWIHAI